MSTRNNAVVAALIALSVSCAKADGVVSGGGSGSAAAFIAAGSPPTLTGTCTTSTQVGGNTAGSFVNTSAPCAAAGTYIMTFATTAPTGWACNIVDRTTSTAALRQTATAQTTATFTVSASVVASDVLQFNCMAY